MYRATLSVRRLAQPTFVCLAKKPARTTTSSGSIIAKSISAQNAVKPTARKSIMTSRAQAAARNMGASSAGSKLKAVPAASTLGKPTIAPKRPSAKSPQPIAPSSKTQLSAPSVVATSSAKTASSKIKSAAKPKRSSM